MDDSFLEQYYEKVIIPIFDSADITSIQWKDHGQVGPDSWAHYFENSQGKEYVLINEDYPSGDYLSDDLTHDMVHVPKTDDGILKVSIGEVWIPNITGYFTLYKEKDRKKSTF